VWLVGRYGYLWIDDAGGALLRSGAVFELRLIFDWGGGCLWCGNDAARARFGVGPVEDVLPLSDEVRQHLARLSVWHDGALDWADPAGASPWGSDEFARFEAAAQVALARVRAELGARFHVCYEPLG
jgi:hypothetical protein